MKQCVQFAAYAILLVGTLVFGFLGMPTEMGLAIVASSIALVFSDIERFKRFKGAGFEAELREQMVAIVEKETELLPVPDVETTSPLSAPIDPAMNMQADIIRRFHTAIPEVCRSPPR